MKKSTATQIAITAVIGLSSLALSNVSSAQTVGQTFDNAFGQSVQFNVASTSGTAALKKAINKALLKHAKLPVEKRKGKCPTARVALNPGSINRTQFQIVLRKIRPEIKPYFHKFESTRVNAQWRYKGTLEAVCVVFEGRGHSNWDGWRDNFKHTNTGVVTTALYVQ